MKRKALICKDAAADAESASTSQDVKTQQLPLEDAQRRDCKEKDHGAQRPSAVSGQTLHARHVVPRAEVTTSRCAFYGLRQRGRAAVNNMKVDRYFNELIN